MKNLRFRLACMLLVFIVNPYFPQAQLFKQLLNTVKNTNQSQVNDKSNQTTNKAASKNTNDTSASDVTLKALGLLTGGGGVSAEDSAAAIKSFKTASGGSGIFYQYINISSFKSQAPLSDTSSSFFTSNGNGRSEMRIPMPGASVNKMIVIGHTGQPKYSVSLYPDSKTYSLNVIDTSLINSNRQSYKVTKMGNEMVNGYNCIHSKLVSTFGSGMFKSSSTTDVWTSNDVPGYDLFKKLANMGNVTPTMMKALQQAGADGMFVKMKIESKDYSMTMTLFKAERKPFPATLFEIPAGYNQSKYNMFYHMMPGVKD